MRPFSSYRTGGRLRKKTSAFDAWLLVVSVEKRLGGGPRCLYCLTGLRRGGQFCDSTCEALALSDAQRYAAALGYTLRKAARA